jgi:hypothetical protein
MYMYVCIYKYIYMYIYTCIYIWYRIIDVIHIKFTFTPWIRLFMLWHMNLHLYMNTRKHNFMYAVFILIQIYIHLFMEIELVYMCVITFSRCKYWMNI